MVQLPNEVVYPPVSENITDEPPTVVSTHAGDVIPTSVADVQPTSSQLRNSVTQVCWES